MKVPEARILIYAALFCLTAGCGRLKSDHPQAGENTSDSLQNRSGIIHYADSITGISGQLDKEASLNYTQKDSSFRVTKYSSNGIPLLYIKDSKSNEYEKVEERYFLKNGQLVLYALESKRFDGSGTVRRDYYRNGVLFYSESKQGMKDDELHVIPFKENKTETAMAPDLQSLKDALEQNNEFDLYFDSIADYPQARYLVLSSGGINAYKTAILLEKEDDFTHKLSSDPEKFKGQKLELKWKMRNGEAVYISGRLR